MQTTRKDDPEDTSANGAMHEQIQYNAIRGCFQSIDAAARHP
jgi:hypothetical protein